MEKLRGEKDARRDKNTCDVDALFCKLEKADEEKVTNLPPVANEDKMAENSHLPGFCFSNCDVGRLANYSEEDFTYQGFFFPNFVM